jgi:hypothetical protein
MSIVFFVPGFLIEGISVENLLFQRHSGPTLLAAAIISTLPDMFERKESTNE